MAAETGFLIDGTVYEVPELDSLTMAERRVMYELSELTQEDFVPEQGETDEDHEARVERLTRNPGFVEALMHIAYQRGNPGLKREKVKLVVEGTNYLDAVELLRETKEDEEVPLASTTEPDAPSQSDSVIPSATSGLDSTNGSDPQGSDPQSIGITRLGTSFPESRRTGSAA